MKRTLLEILIIVVIASLIGIVFNFLVDNPLPLVKAPADKNAVPDTTLLSKSFEANDATLEKSITFEQMKKATADDRFIIIDARSPEAYGKSHIGNAINIFPEYEKDKEQEYVASIFQIPEGKIIIVYCDGGTCDLSVMLSKELMRFGFKRIFIYHGGWEEWSKKNK